MTPYFYYPANTLPIELCRLSSRLSEESSIYNVYANRETLRTPYGNRTRDSAVKGQRLNRLSNGANKVSLGLVYRFCSSLSFSLIPDVGKLTLAAPTGFEPVPHAVTGRYCSHSTMEPSYLK